jgi:hypothetical protein
MFLVEHFWGIFRGGKLSIGFCSKAWECEGLSLRKICVSCETGYPSVFKKNGITIGL